MTKRWVAVQDKNTCGACRQNHGSTDHRPPECQNPNGCRCVKAPDPPAIGEQERTMGDVEATAAVGAAIAELLRAMREAARRGLTVDPPIFETESVATRGGVPLMTSITCEGWGVYRDTRVDLSAPLKEEG